jgi:1-deoxy-D-xylulose-5-phosphate synthase
MGSLPAEEIVLASFHTPPPANPENAAATGRPLGLRLAERRSYDRRKLPDSHGGSLLLDSIDGPAALRRLDADQLAALAEEIRAVLIEAVSVNGGHLGSNLGAVELTLALHRVFESPRDAIVWDTGHQAYVHKLVTGRRDGFGRLRQAGGLSGYPSRSESEHDLVENSHASTAVSYAYGLAIARDARDDDSAVVAVIGDGALTGGLAYEALNNLGVSGRRAVIVLNDNGRCYAPTVSRLTLVGKREDAIAAAVEPGDFFRALGLGYVGPVDGHDIAALEVVLRDAAAADGPVVVHVITRKGEGYLPAEADDEKRLHDVGAFDLETGVPHGRNGSSYTAAFSAKLIELASTRPEIVAVTAGMPGSTGLLPFADRFPERCFDVGIAEQHAVASAAGMAMRGLRPVVAIYSTFLSRAWDQLLYDVALHALPVVFCIDRAGITGDDGPSHHGLFDLALLTKLPGITVFAPSSYEELGGMLEEAFRITSGPVALRWPKTAARHVDPDQVGHGRGARKVREGSDVCILAVGKLVEAAEEAAALLAARGVGASLWDVRTVPPDPRMLADARRHRLVVTAEDGIAEGGIGALLAAALSRMDDATPSPPTVTLGTPAAFLPHGKTADLLANLGLDGPGIAATVFKALEPAT